MSGDDVGVGTPRNSQVSSVYNLVSRHVTVMVSRMFAEVRSLLDFKLFRNYI